MSEALDRLGLAFVARHPESAAAALETLDPAEAAGFLATVPAKEAATLLTQTTPAIAQAFLAHLSAECIGEIVNEMSIAAGVATLRLLNPDERALALQQFEGVRRKALARLLHFSQDTVGAIMDPLYPACSADLAVASLGERLQASPSKDFTCVFVLDRAQCPVGVVRTHDVFLSDPGQSVSAIAAPCDYRIHGTTDWRSVAGNPDLRRWDALPVVDDENRYIGALREDAVMRQAGDSEAIRAGGSWRRTSLALGEVFRLGLAGMLETIENPKD